MKEARDQVELALSRGRSHHLTISDLLLAVGIDTENEDLAATPERFVRALLEMSAGVSEDPVKILGATFDAGPYDEMIVVRGVEFTSICEHHLLPFMGNATVGYIPRARVVGLSKLARLVQCFARRPQIQERMTSDIANAINDALLPVGVGVIVEARHECMACRGVRQPRATMVTSALKGKMVGPAARAEFFAMKG